MILALDPSSRIIGWCIFDGDRLMAWANVKIRGVGARRFLAIEELLDQLTSQSQYPIDEIAMEAPKWRNARKPAHSFFATIGIIRTWVQSHKLPLFEYSPATVKKSAAGNGHATKEEVAKILCIEYPELAEDVYGHASDACAVGIHHLGVKRLQAMEKGG